MITRALIVLNVLAFLWEVKVGGPGLLNFGLGGGSNANYTPIDPYALAPVQITVGHEYYRMITSAFIHYDLAHIGLNMLSLYWLGRFVEAGLGPWRMLLLYFISLIAASTAVVLFSPPDAATLGASGAIYGLFGAIFGIGLKLRERGSDLVRSNIGILVINLVFSFGFPGISWQAHIGGLIAGFLASLALFWPPRPVHAVVVDRTSGAQYESTLEEPPNEQHRY